MPACNFGERFSNWLGHEHLSVLQSEMQWPALCLEQVVEFTYNKEWIFRDHDVTSSLNTSQENQI